MIGAKRFKVSAIVPKQDGTGEWFQKIGVAFENKDQSLNAYIELLPLTAMSPKGIKLHIREVTEADMEKSRASTRGSSTGPQPSSPSAASEDVPY